MSVNIPDRHRPIGPPQGSVPPLAPPGVVAGPPPSESLGGAPAEWTLGPPPGWHPPPQQPQQQSPQRPRRRRRLIVGLIAGAALLLVAVWSIAPLSGRDVAVDPDPDGDDRSYAVRFADSDVPFELFDDGDRSAKVRGGMLLLESSVGELVDSWTVGPMDSARVSAAVAPAPGSSAGLAIGGPDGSADGWYVAAVLTDTGQLVLHDPDSSRTEASADVMAPGPDTKVSLEMTTSEDGPVQVFTAVLLEPAEPAFWQEVEGSRVQLELPARTAATVSVLVAPLAPRAPGDTDETARAAFDDVELSYDPAD